MIRRGQAVRGRGLLCALTALFGSSTAPTSLHAQWKTPWDYGGARGPDHWSALDLTYAPCNTGREQSPIDIRATTTTIDLPALRFDYRSLPLAGLTDNGRTIRVNYHAHGGENVLSVGNERYYTY